jgi:hypothetical protein
VSAGDERDVLLAAIKKHSGADSKQTPFWEFWSGLLDDERAKIDALKLHPGWGYRRRRPALGGGAEFEVDDPAQIEKQSQGSFIVDALRKGKPEQNGLVGNRSKFYRFELTGAGNSNRLTGVSRDGTPIDRIPGDGMIFPDWVSRLGELRRKEDCLKRLLAGDAALPWLAEVLPDGPSSHGDALSFTAILGKPYNALQAEAVSKSLVEGTVTCIQGPPGTGKTSVIAEITMQMTRRGKRVLIASQTNLAVDNALERLLNEEDVFPVRVGRPSSITIDLVEPLHIDNASRRYQERLLARSDQAERKLVRETSEWRSLPNSTEVAQKIAEWRIRNTLSSNLRRVKAEMNGVSAQQSAASQRLRQAEADLEEACVWAGLPDSYLVRYLATLDALEARGHDLKWIDGHRAEAAVAIRSQRSVEQLHDGWQKLERMRADGRPLRQDIDEHQAAIDLWSSCKSALDAANRHNTTLEQKRSNAGFWSGLWSAVTEAPMDIAGPLRKVTAAAGPKDVAEKALPALRSRRAIAQARVQRQESEWARQYNLVFSVGREDAILPSGVDLPMLLEVAASIRAEGCSDLLPMLCHHRDIRAAFRTLEKTSSAESETSQALRKCQALEAHVRTELKSAKDASPWLIDLAIKLGIEVPIAVSSYSQTSLPNSNEVNIFFQELETGIEDKHSQLATSSAILAAIARYRGRLSQPVVDLQKAALEEADVVGATCSAIAGRTDFDTDFDAVIVDEAGRTTPLELVMAIVRGKSVILVGDHKQLPPFIDKDVRDGILAPDVDLIDRSIFQRVFETAHESRTVTLQSQYRMAPDISDLVTSISYPDTPLITPSDMPKRSLLLPGFQHVHFVEPRGISNIATKRGTGIVNEAEAKAAVDVLLRFMRVPRSTYDLRCGRLKEEAFTIGIVAMYRQQAHLIERLIKAAQPPPVQRDSVTFEIDTVDAFQGREMDAVIVSFCETDSRMRRFFYDRRRLNVALSRARHHLVLIANMDSLGSSREAFKADNPLFELREWIDRGLKNGTASRSHFDA